MVALNFIKNIFLIILCASLLFSIGCQKKLSTADFVITVDFDNHIEVGTSTTFFCKLMFPETLKVEHSAQLISYEINGNKEKITAQKIIEKIPKGKNIERSVTLSFEKEGTYLITFFSKFNIANSESTKYLIEKTVSVNVQ